MSVFSELSRFITKAIKKINLSREGDNVECIPSEKSIVNGHAKYSDEEQISVLKNGSLSHQGIIEALEGYRANKTFGFTNKYPCSSEANANENLRLSEVAEVKYQYNGIQSGNTFPVRVNGSESTEKVYELRSIDTSTDRVTRKAQTYLAVKDSVQQQTYGLLAAKHLETSKMSTTKEHTPIGSKKRKRTLSKTFMTDSDEIYRPTPEKKPCLVNRSAIRKITFINDEFNISRIFNDDVQLAKLNKRLANALSPISVHQQETNEQCDVRRKRCSSAPDLSRLPIISRSYDEKCLISTDMEAKAEPLGKDCTMIQQFFTSFCSDLEHGKQTAVTSNSSIISEIDSSMSKSPKKLSKGQRRISQFFDRVDSKTQRRSGGTDNDSEVNMKTTSVSPKLEMKAASPEKCNNHRPISPKKFYQSNGKPQTPGHVNNLDPRGAEIKKEPLTLSSKSPLRGAGCQQQTIIFTKGNPDMKIVMTPTKKLTPEGKKRHVSNPKPHRNSSSPKNATAVKQNLIKSATKLRPVKRISTVQTKTTVAGIQEGKKRSASESLQFVEQKVSGAEVKQENILSKGSPKIKKVLEPLDGNVDYLNSAESYREAVMPGSPKKVSRQTAVAKDKSLVESKLCKKRYERLAKKLHYSSPRSDEKAKKRSASLQRSSEHIDHKEASSRSFPEVMARRRSKSRPRSPKNVSEQTVNAEKRSASEPRLSKLSKTSKMQVVSECSSPPFTIEGTNVIRKRSVGRPRSSKNKRSEKVNSEHSHQSGTEGVIKDRRSRSRPRSPKSVAENQGNILQSSLSPESTTKLKERCASEPRLSKTGKVQVVSQCSSPPFTIEGTNVIRKRSVGRPRSLKNKRSDKVTLAHNPQSEGVIKNRSRSKPRSSKTVSKAQTKMLQSSLYQFVTRINSPTYNNQAKSEHGTHSAIEVATKAKKRSRLHNNILKKQIVIKALSEPRPPETSSRMSQTAIEGSCMSKKRSRSQPRSPKIISKEQAMPEGTVKAKNISGNEQRLSKTSKAKRKSAGQPGSSEDIHKGKTRKSQTKKKSSIEGPIKASKSQSGIVAATKRRRNQMIPSERISEKQTKTSQRRARKSQSVAERTLVKNLTRSTKRPFRIKCKAHARMLRWKWRARKPQCKSGDQRLHKNVSKVQTASKKASERSSSEPRLLKTQHSDPDIRNRTTPESVVEVSEPTSKNQNTNVAETALSCGPTLADAEICERSVKPVNGYLGICSSPRTRAAPENSPSTQPESSIKVSKVPQTPSLDSCHFHLPQCSLDAVNGYKYGHGKQRQKKTKRSAWSLGKLPHVQKHRPIAKMVQIAERVNGVHGRQEPVPSSEDHELSEIQTVNDVSHSDSKTTEPASDVSEPPTIPDKGCSGVPETQQETSEAVAETAGQPVRGMLRRKSLRLSVSERKFDVVQRCRSLESIVDDSGYFGTPKQQVVERRRSLRCSVSEKIFDHIERRKSCASTLDVNGSVSKRELPTRRCRSMKQLKQLFLKPVHVKLDKLQYNAEGIITWPRYLKGTKVDEQQALMDLANYKRKGGNTKRSFGTYAREYVVECIREYDFDVGSKQLIFLVKWEGYSVEYSTWEPLEHLEHCRSLLMQFMSLRLTGDVLDSLCDRLSISNRWSDQALIETLNVRNLKSLPDKLDVQSTLLKLIINPPHERHSKRIEEGKNALMMYQLIQRRDEQQRRLKAWEESINAMTKEAALITIENDVDLEHPPEGFTYIHENIATDGIVIDSEPTVSCDCQECGPKMKNCCGKQPCNSFTYKPNAKITVNPGTALYECNRRCKCPPNCRNRVVQHGRKVPLCIFRTSNGCGWGVKAMRRIPCGEFVCEYVGEIITHEEAEVRGRAYDKKGLTYLFDLDYNSKDNPYTVDAAKFGNISHFINHSCEPNLGVYAVWIDCSDPNLPRLALFALREIQRNEELTFDYMITIDPLTPEKSRFLHTPEKNGTVNNGRTLCKCQADTCRRYLF